MSRRRTAIAFLAVVVLAATGGWILGQRVSSPADVAANTAAPAPSPILVPADQRVLSTDVVTRGTGRFGSPREILVPATRIGSSEPIVTALPDPGFEATEGDVLLTVSGRPLLVLLGETPGYRDLGPGLFGDDVLQFEAALERLGYSPGEVDGFYDEQTEAAVSAWYGELGYAPAVLSVEQIAERFQGVPFVGATPTAGVMVAASELFVTPSLPVRVAEIMSQLGEPVDGVVLTVTDANVAIDGSLPVGQAGLVTVGMTVQIDEPDLAIDASGVVSRVAENPGTDGVDGFHVYFEVEVLDGSSTLVNASVRLTIPVESTATEALVVPITALNLRADGVSTVQVDRDGTLESMTVTPGLSAQGLVEITLIDGRLAAGDLVVVGFDSPQSAEATNGEPTVGTTSDPNGG